jgi:Proliferating cell nuclear antigen, C-terminal domain
MPAAEFKRIVSELSSIGDTVVIGVTKDGIKFSTSGDIGSANVTCRQNTSVDKQVVLSSQACTSSRMWSCTLGCGQLLQAAQATVASRQQRHVMLQRSPAIAHMLCLLTYTFHTSAGGGDGDRPERAGDVDLCAAVPQQLCQGDAAVQHSEGAPAGRRTATSHPAAIRSRRSITTVLQHPASDWCS